MNDRFGKCQHRTFRDYPERMKVIGSPCFAFEWKDGLCRRHHPETKRATLLRQIDSMKRKIAENEKQIAALDLILTAEVTPASKRLQPGLRAVRPGVMEATL